MKPLPRLARWLLGRYLPAREREFIIGDLEEAFEEHRGALGSRTWLWLQVLALLWSRGERPHGSDVMTRFVTFLRNTLRLFSLDGLRQDVRLAVRMLAKNRSFTIAALLTLTICIGINSAMFGLVRSVLMKPLPFPDGDRLVVLYSSLPKAGVQRGGASVPSYFDRHGTVPALEDVAIWRTDTRRLGIGASVEQVRSLRTTASLLTLLRVRPAQGRLFTDDDVQAGGAAALLLTHEAWQSKFGGAAILNQTVRMNETPVVVVGILPPGFSFLSNEIEIIEPLAFSASQRSEAQRYDGAHQMVGRLRPGATITQAQAQLDALDASLVDRTPHFRQRLTDGGYRTVISSLRDDFVTNVSSVVYLLWGAVGLVLVIGFVNVANLVTIRARGRSRELAVRHALGADIGQLARQLLCENVLLSVGGGVLGIALGVWILGWIRSLGMAALPRGFEIRTDVTGALVTLGSTVVIGILLGLVPAVRLRRLNLNVEIREESRGGTSGRRDGTMRNVLAMAQFAASFVVVAGAALLFTSFQDAMRESLGFQPAGVTTATVELPTPYRNPQAQSQYVRRTLDTLDAMPEVSVAGVTSVIPYSIGYGSNARVSSEAQPGKLADLITVTITPGYFEALSVPVLSGRDFDTQDGTEGRVVIDDRLARAFWPDGDAVGRRLYFPEDAKDPAKVTATTKFLTVIGVVGNMRYASPRAGRTPSSTLYFTYDQRPGTTVSFVIKSKLGTDISSRVRTVMTETDPTVPVYRQRSEQAWIDLAMTDRRAPMLIASMYAAVSLLLAAVGIYGVISYGVAQRRRELGVRMALGGTSATIFQLVLGGGIRIVAIGLVVGIAGAYAVGQLMKSLLYGTTAASGIVLIFVAGGLSLVALVATMVPAWRASRINPITVLHE